MRHSTCPNHPDNTCMMFNGCLFTAPPAFLTNTSGRVEEHVIPCAPRVDEHVDLTRPTLNPDLPVRREHLASPASSQIYLNKKSSRPMPFWRPQLHPDTAHVRRRRPHLACGRQLVSVQQLAVGKQANREIHAASTADMHESITHVTR